MNGMNGKITCIVIGMIMLFSIFNVNATENLFDLTSSQDSLTGKVTISGSTGLPGAKIISIYVVETDTEMMDLTIYNIADKLIYMEEMKTNGDTGGFTFTFKLPQNLSTGLYKAILATEDMEQPVEYIFQYKDPLVKEKAVQEINKKQDANGIGQVISHYWDELELEANFYEVLDKDRIHQMILNMRPDLGGFETYIDFKSVFEFAVKIEGLNSEKDINKIESLWLPLLFENDHETYALFNNLVTVEQKEYACTLLKNMEFFIDKNEDGFQKLEDSLYKSVVLATVSKAPRWTDLQIAVTKTYADLFSLPMGAGSSYEKVQSKDEVFKKMMNKEYKLYEDVTSQFIIAVNEQLAEETSKINSRGSGGGAGGTSVRVSGAPSTQPKQTDVPSGPQSASPTFTDLDSVAWAKESIDALAAAGIIEGFDNGLFYPNERITRAQFIKLLVAAFGIVVQDAKTDFQDVKEDDWFYNYVASAQQMNIAIGRGNGFFGPNEEISRQEMAVLLLRAARASNIVIASGESQIERFSDEGQIASYAVEDIYTLANAGIISGVGNGLFAPLETATRAQAAKIIHSLLKNI